MVQGNTNSPYSAAFTACALVYYEMNAILPLMMAEDAEEQLKLEVKEKRHLLMNSQSGRHRVMCELRRRYAAMNRDFWDGYLRWDEPMQRAALLFVLMKTYRLVFDFQINVTLKKWKSADQTLTNEDVMMELNEIAADDEFVDSWSQKTKAKVVNVYLVMLRQSGMLNEKTNQLQVLPLTDHQWAWFVNQGEEWFLEACLLYPFEVERIKNSSL